MGMDAIAVYLEQVNRAVAKGDATEHTHRPALKGLIEALGKNITATNEPKRVACGAPDFVVSRRIRRAEHGFGYIECKDIGVNVKKEEKTPSFCVDEGCDRAW